MIMMRVVGECFFWYRLTRVFPDKFHRAVKRLCVCVCSESTSATVSKLVVSRANHVSPENWVSPGDVHHTTYTVVPGSKVSSSSDSSSSTEEADMEQYEKEPGIRRPSRSFSGDLDVDLEEYNEEPVPRKRQPGSAGNKGWSVGWFLV